ncbi:MAG: hypothetical protein R3C52_11965 [Hyphomonadaceae bacterium]
MTIKTEERTAPELSRAPRGWWRNLWYTDGPVLRSDGSTENGLHYGYGLWPSREVAEQKALDWLREHADAGPKRDTYLGPRFFAEAKD